jgi:hypothetical protein
MTPARFRNLRFRVPGSGMRRFALALAGLVLASATARGQGLGALPTPLPQPFSPNGVLRPIIPYQPAVPIPTMRPLSIVPLPTPAPNIRIAPLKTPSSEIANQALGLMKTVPVHRRWPVLQPRESSTPAAGGGAAKLAAGGGQLVPNRMTGAATSHAGVPDHRRPLGW